MTRKLLTTLVLILATLATACSSTPDAEVTAQPAPSVDPGPAPAPTEPTSTEAATPDSAAPESTPETTGLEGSSSSDGSLHPDIVVRRIDVPFVPAVTLPDVSVLSETGTIVDDELGDLAGDGTGLNVISAECAADGGELVYQGSDEDSSFLDAETDGSGSFTTLSGEDGGIVEITVNGDGSGTYERTGGPDGITQITVSADGSGSYENTGGPDGITQITVNADGSGSYENTGGPDGITQIAINADGSGSYENTGGPNGIVEVIVNADGSGVYENSGGPDGIVEIRTEADGSWVYGNTGGPDGIVELVVNADGSGSFSVTGGPEGSVDITVDSDGQGTYSEIIDSVSFTTDIGILDPNLLIVAPRPVFAIADRFPPLATLGSIQPPCVTVIRLDADVLFDFNSDQLRPAAGPVLDEVAQALVASGQSLEVHGHTDAIGTDDYNQDLSERRAASVAAALLERGVSADITTVGFGESRPVAANESADGSDDPAGRQQNRRVEIVVGE